MYQFPFTAVVGQDKLKLALILNLIDPKIGGVLISGPQGTGKSTIVRAIQEILPEINFVNLPLGTTIDRLVGGINIEHLINKGIKKLQPGLLAQAHNGILYVDEINLLQDHLVDLLLDTASSGVNFVEREGFSLAHPSQFILIGTMNPEEGELRPQIADRLGIEIHVSLPKEKTIRANISKQVFQFQTDPDSFIKKFKTKQDSLRKKVAHAKKEFHRIPIPDTYFDIVTNLILKLQIISQRADVIMLRCARAIAALNERLVISKEDLSTAIELLYGDRISIMFPDLHLGDLIATFDEIWHRIPSALPDSSQKQTLSNFTPNSRTYKSNPQLEKYNAKNPLDKSHPEIPEVDSSRESSTDQYSNYNLDEESVSGYKSGKLKTTSKLLHFDAPSYRPYIAQSPLKIDIHHLLLQIKKRQRIVNYTNKGSRICVHSYQDGSYILAKKPNGHPHSVAFVPSIKYHHLHYPRSLQRMEHIVYPSKFRPNPELRINLTYDDIHEKIYERRAPYSFYFIVDASASMRRTLKQTIKVIQSVHAEGYKKKDKVCVISFQGKRTTVLQRPSVSFSIGLDKLNQIKATSYTPLAAALKKGLILINQEQIKGFTIPVFVIISDLGANISLQHPEMNASTVEDFSQIAKELHELAKQIGKKHYIIIIMKPQKSFATRYLGVDPFSVKKIEQSFLLLAKARIFEFDAYDPTNTIIQLNQILD